MYKNEYGLSLVEKDLSIFSAGTGDRGGTDGIYEELPTLLKLIETDCDAQGAKLFRVVALLDNDRAGKFLLQVLLKQYRTLKQNRDIYLLNIIFPRNSSEPTIVDRQINSENAKWNNLDCEIEDLLGGSLLDAFQDDSSNAPRIPPVEVEGFRHYEWSDAAKSRLIRFAEENAMLEDVIGIVELLKSIRHYLGLPQDGVS
ncbi:MAG: hypothetical protein Q8K54_10510 [Gallionella sp.]|nr:hypothetical protein [Gallionella sp.]